MTPVSTRRTGGGAGGDGSVQVRSAGAGLAESDLAALSTRRALAPTQPAYPPVRGSTPPSLPGAAASSGEGGSDGEGESAWRAKGNAEFKAGRYAAAVEAYTRCCQLACAQAFSLTEPSQVQLCTPTFSLSRCCKLLSQWLRQQGVGHSVGFLAGRARPSCFGLAHSKHACELLARGHAQQGLSCTLCRLA